MEVLVADPYAMIDDERLTPLPMDDLLASCIQSGTGRQLPPSWRMTA